MSAAAGPQLAGGRYWCGYWREEYTVTAIDGDWLTVQWAGGAQYPALHGVGPGPGPRYQPAGVKHSAWP